MASNNLKPDELFTVKGLVAVVTGGGTGIGLMIASALENNGASKVYIVGRRKEVLDKAAQTYAKHGNIIPLQGDVTSRQSLSSIVATVESQVGHINLLVNSSGISGPHVSWPSENADVKDFQKSLWDLPLDEFQRTFEVNTTSLFYSTVAFLDLLDKGNKHGLPGVTSQVINIASISAFRREDRPFSVSYNLSKQAAVHLTKILSSMLVEYNIRVNAICPGIHPSEMTVHHPAVLPPSVVPMKRQGTTEEMAGLTLYMASPTGAYLTGSIMVTDGGRIFAFPATY